MERQAINFVVQASACDLMKVTMDRIHQILERMFPFDLKSEILVFEDLKIFKHLSII